MVGGRDSFGREQHFFIFLNRILNIRIPKINICTPPLVVITILNEINGVTMCFQKLSYVGVLCRVVFCFNCQEKDDLDSHKQVLVNGCSIEIGWCNSSGYYCMKILKAVVGGKIWVFRRL